MKEDLKKSKGGKVALLAVALVLTTILSGCGEKKDPVQMHQETVALAKSAITVFDGISQRSEYEYDDHGNATKIKYYEYDGDLCVDEAIKEYKYDDMGRMLKYRYGEKRGENGDMDWGEQYTAVYDGSGNIKKECYEGDGYSIRIVHEYDKHGIRKKSKEFRKDEDENTEYLYSCKEYDDQGNTIKKEDYDQGSLDESTEYKYDDHGNLIKEEHYGHGTLDYSIEYEYDVRGNEISRAHCYDDGSIFSKTENEYDDLGNMTKTVEYGSNRKVKSVSESKYDDRGKIIKYEEYQYDEIGAIIYHLETEYDERGKNSVCYDENGEIMYREEREYDDRGNIINSVTYDENGEVEYRKESEYDDRNEIKKSIEYDKDGIVTSFHLEYDSLGRPVKEITCDADGNILRLLEHSYDEKGYQTHIHLVEYNENGEIKKERTCDWEVVEATVTIPEKCESENQCSFGALEPRIDIPKRYESVTGVK